MHFVIRTSALSSYDDKTPANVDNAHVLLRYGSCGLRRVDVVVRLVPRQGYRHPDQQVLISGDGVMPVQKSGLFEAFATIFKNAPAGSYVRKVVTNDPSLKTNFRIQNDLVAFQTPTGTFITIKQLNI